MKKRLPIVVRHNDRRVVLPPHPTDCCPSKRRYDTEIAARMGAQSAINNPLRRVSPRRLWVYPCEACLGWHMTSRADGNATAAVTPSQLYEGLHGFPPAASPPARKEAR